MKFFDIINEDYTINWDKVGEVKEFALMKECPQSMKWHAEGNVWNHVVNVCACMKEYLDSLNGGVNKYDSYLLMAAALCHDLGKYPTTKWDKEANDWKTSCHGQAGEKIVRQLFIDEEPTFRESVCYMTRYHMNFHHIFDGNDVEKQEKSIIKMSLGAVTVKLMAILNMCDSLGSKNDVETREDVEEHFKKIKDIALKLSCWDKHYYFPTLRNKMEWLRGKRFSDLTDETYSYCRSAVYVMIGLPGSGKNYWIENVLKKNHPNELIVLIRDDIRTEIGIEGEKPQGSKKQEEEVTKILNQRYMDAVKQHKDVVINNTHMLRRWRNALKDLVMSMENPPMFVYIVVDTPIEICKERRKGMMPLDVIDKMFNEWEMPDSGECDNLTFVKGY